MKLAQPLTEAQRKAVEAALGALQSTHAAFEAKLAAFADSTAARGVVETQLAVARHSAKLLPGGWDRVEALRGQLGEAGARCQTAQAARDNARQAVLAAIREAGNLIHAVCAPLLVQFKCGLADVLRPFYSDPERAALNVQDAGSERGALLRFLQRGQYVSRTAGPAEIEQLAFELGETLRHIRDGADLWAVSPAIHRRPAPDLAGSLV